MTAPKPDLAAAARQLNALVERMQEEVREYLGGEPCADGPELFLAGFLPSVCGQQVAAAQGALKAALAEAPPEFEWTVNDKPLPEDDEIKAVFPTRSGNFRRYEEAVRLVGAKRSKYALVDLVNWLLSRTEGWK